MEKLFFTLERTATFILIGFFTVFAGCNEVFLSKSWWMDTRASKTVFLTQKNLKL
jgi:hypothetical protein